MRLRSDPLASGALVWLAVVFAVAIGGRDLAAYGPFDMTRDAHGLLENLRPPSPAHWLGTTDLGNDVWSQLVLGTRTTVAVGLTAAVVSVGLGLAIGLVSGYWGGTADLVLMRLVEVAYAIPFEPLAILLLSLLTRNIGTMILAIVSLFWRQSARVVRTQVLAVRDRPFVKSARVSGVHPMVIILRHILPNVAGLAFVYLPVAFGNAIVAAATISFLGFGNPNLISWGEMLRSAFTEGAVGTALWWSLPPGLCIMLTTTAVYLAMRPLEAALDPRLRPQL